MIYQAYQTCADAMDPLRAMARMTRTALAHPLLGLSENTMVRKLAAACEVFETTQLTHARPSYKLDSTTVGNREVAVTEEAAHVTPFGTLLRFKKDIAEVQPRVLVVAPLSGHFATLLRGTVKTLLPENDVYITDWHNARDAPLSAGRFGFDDYVDHVIKFLEVLGPGAHIVAVCQPCVQVLVAAAVMAEGNNPAAPKSMTLMAGPIDCRIAPTEVNRLAMKHPIEWFEKNLIGTVPARFPGAGRRVYPGFMQLTAFMAMNLDRHVRSHLDLWDNIANGETEKAAFTRDFYDEYFAVLDLDAEFYLETVNYVFQKHLLPLGLMKFRGQRVDPRAIRRTSLFTVEGERDDICAVGQTLAAHDLCTGLRPYRKRHHLQPGVGHYGVFSGSKWTKQIYPILRNVILSSD